MSKTTFIIEPGKQTIIMTRTFNAPRARVFKAYTDPDLIPQWWGPRHTTTVVEALEPQKGGQWRYVQNDGQDHVFAHYGVYHEVISPERLTYTYEFEGMPGHVGLVVTTFEERDGETLLTETSLFPSVEDRDAVVESGMEGGAVVSMDRLEEILVKQDPA